MGRGRSETRRERERELIPVLVLRLLQEESKSYLSYTAKYLSSPASKDTPKLDAAFRAKNLQWE